MNRKITARAGLVLACLTTSSFAGAAIQTYSYNATVSGNSPESLILSQGVDLDRNLGRNVCVMGTEEKVIYTGGGGMETSGTYSHNRLMEDMALSVSADYTKGAWGIKLAHDYAKNTEEDDYSFTFLYNNRIHHEDHKIVNPIVIDRYKPYVDSLMLAEFRSDCGNRYVEQVSLGASVNFAVKINLYTRKDKEEVKNKVNGHYDNFTVNGNFKSVVDNAKVDGYISILAVQMGGVESELGRVLGTSVDGKAPIASCSFSDMTYCQQLLANINDYAASQFPSQLKVANPQYSVIGYHFKDYGLASVPPLPPIVSPEVRAERLRIAEKLRELTQHKDRAFSFLEQFPLLVSQKKTEVDGLIQTLDYNINKWIDIHTRCWEMPDECFAYKATIEPYLLPVDLGVLVNSNRIRTQFDASGKVEIGVFERISSTNQAHYFDFPVQVPDDFVLIGGGGEGSGNPGNFLTASYPNRELDTWLVSSKDHTYGNLVKLKGYAIGMKIEGLSARELRDMIRVDTNYSVRSQYPSVSVSVPNGYKLIGGGMRVNWSGYGNIATESYPYNASTWKVASKDHSYPSAATIDAFALSLPESIPGVGTVDVTTVNLQSVYSEYPSATATVVAGHALTGCGAKVNWRPGAGNLMWRLKPLSEGSSMGCLSSSKDHSYYSPATLDIYTLGVRIY